MKMQALFYVITTFLTELQRGPGTAGQPKLADTATPSTQQSPVAESYDPAWVSSPSQKQLHRQTRHVFPVSAYGTYLGLV